MKKTILLLFVISCLSSCAFQTHYLQSGSILFEPVAPETVAVHLGDIEEEYIVIAAIAVDAMGQGKEAKELLQKKAASLGANAVIRTELTKIGSAITRTGLSGVAVRVK